MSKRKMIAFGLLIIFVLGIAFIYFSHRQMNFSGKVITWSDETAVENIAINGSTQSILFYEIPKNTHENPRNNVTYLTLKNIKAIIPWISPGRPMKFYSFNGDEYLEVRVLWKDSNLKLKHYLLDKNAKVSFHERSDKKQSKELSFFDFLELMID